MSDSQPEVQEKHWLRLTPREYLIRNNDLAVQPPADSIRIRIYIRNREPPSEDCVLCLRSPGNGPFYIPATYPVPLILPPGERDWPISIHDCMFHHLKALQVLRVESIIRLQVMDHCRDSPIAWQLDPDVNGQRELCLHVLLSIDRKESQQQTWLPFSRIQQLSATEAVHSLAEKYAEYDKAAYITEGVEELGERFYERLCNRILKGMIKAAAITGWSDGYPEGFFILRREASTNKPTMLMYPRTKAQMENEEDALARDVPGTITVGEWGGDEERKWSPGVIPWKDLFRDDGSVRVKWVDPRTGMVLV